MLTTLLNSPLPILRPLVTPPNTALAVCPPSQFAPFQAPFPPSQSICARVFPASVSEKKTKARGNVHRFMRTTSQEKKGLSHRTIGEDEPPSDTFLRNTGTDRDCTCSSGKEQGKSWRNAGVTRGGACWDCSAAVQSRVRFPHSTATKGRSTPWKRPDFHIPTVVAKFPTCRVCLSKGEKTWQFA